MGTDIRIPIGLLTALIGAVLVAYGIWMDPGEYVRSLGVDIDLWWGLVLLVFGAAMLWLGGRRG